MQWGSDDDTAEFVGLTDEELLALIQDPHHPEPASPEGRP
jgi:hypothetical protein